MHSDLSDEILGDTVGDIVPRVILESPVAGPLLRLFPQFKEETRINVLLNTLVLCQIVLVPERCNYYDLIRAWKRPSNFWCGFTVMRFLSSITISRVAHP